MALVGCSATVTPAAEDAGREVGVDGGTDVGVDVAEVGVDGGTDVGAGSGVDAPACFPLANDAPTIMPVCPGGTRCPDCPERTGGGGAIAEGTYDMTTMTVWGSGCGIVANTRVRATLRVRGDSLVIASSGPVDFGGATVSATAEYTFTASATQVRLQRVCPTPDGGPSAYDLEYTADANTLIFAQLPDVFGTPTFTRR
jgi:hypothetical protein